MTLGLSPESGLALVAGTALLGSVHCVAMCGGLVLACAPGRGHPAWQAGRLVTYVALGALSGALGHGLTRLGDAVLDSQRGAGVVLGAVLIALAVRTLWPGAAVVTISERRRPGWAARLKAHLGQSAFAVGMLTGGLPCAWLWSFLALAGSEGDPLRGAVVMAAFWVGSAPGLVAFGWFAGRLAWAPTLRRHAPRITALIMLAAGVLTLVGKLGPASPAPALEDEPGRVLVTENCLHP